MSRQGLQATSEGQSYFEEQRELLVRDIGMVRSAGDPKQVPSADWQKSMEQVLQNINKLNRSLEGIVAVGSEFSSVEALWSHFEGVMGTRNESGGPDDPNDSEAEADQTLPQTNGQ